MRTLVGRIRDGRGGGRPPDRHPRRPAGAEAPRRHVRQRQGRRSTVGQTFTLDDNPEPGDVEPRPPAASRDPRVGRGRPSPADRRRQARAARRSRRRQVDRLHGRRRQQHLRQEGRQPARHRPAGRRADREGPHATSTRRSRPASTGSRSPSSSAPRTSPRCARSRTAARCVMAKIEKPQAVERLAEIIELSDALMVARGDLGVEMPLEAVPGIQKQITRAARRAGKPVVVATQMLESMITAPVPTRAEVSDVATAVFEGADAIMLSAESAAGAVSGRGGGDDGPHRRRRSKRDPTYAGIINAQRSEPEATGADAISLAARADRRDAEAGGDRHLHRVGHDRPARRARAAAGADHRAVADPRHGPPAVAAVGHALRGFARRRRSRRHGRPRLPHRLSTRASPSRATASSSPPACRCGRPARPTCCASPMSDRKARAAAEAGNRGLGQ